MTNASTLGNMSPQLLKVVERAQQEPEGRFADRRYKLRIRYRRQRAIYRLGTRLGENEPA